MKRRRNPSAELIARYGKRLPYLVQDLDRAMRYVRKSLKDGEQIVYQWPDGATRPDGYGTLDGDDYLKARREAIIEVARMLMEASWVTPSMQKSKKSPYLPIVVQWYLNHSIRLPEDVPKTQETLLEYHQMVQAGILKGENAKIPDKQQDLAKALRRFKAGVKKGGLYEQEGCVRAGEFGRYVLFRVDTYDTAAAVFDDTNWCVRNKGYFENYGPPYWLVIDTEAKDGEDDRVCLMHEPSKQIKDPYDNALNEATQRELRPFLEFVFGRWACKYNMRDTEGDLAVGDSWWPFRATDPFHTVQEIVDVIYGIGDLISSFASEASMQCQDAVEDDLKREEYDEDEDGDYDEWIEKMRDTERYSKLIGIAEDNYIDNCDSRLDKEAFRLVGGLVYDPEVALDVASHGIFGVEWGKMKKALNIKPQVETRRRRDGTTYEARVGYYIRGNSRFSREHTTPKMEAWAERSIDRFLALIPDEDQFRRYISRRDGAGLWKPLYAADRMAEGR